MPDEPATGQQPQPTPNATEPVEQPRRLPEPPPDADGILKKGL